MPLGRQKSSLGIFGNAKKSLGPARIIRNVLNHFSSLGILWAFFSVFTAFFSLSKAKKLMKAKKDEEVTGLLGLTERWRHEELTSVIPQISGVFLVNRAQSHPKPPHAAR